MIETDGVNAEKEGEGGSIGTAPAYDESLLIFPKMDFSREASSQVPSDALRHQRNNSTLTNLVN